MDTTSRNDERGRAGELMDMSGRELRAPRFPRVSRQSPLQRLFLKRLQRLVLLSRYSQQHLAFSEQESILLRKAAYSVYRDCIELGMMHEARAIVRASASAYPEPGQ